MTPKRGRGTVAIARSDGFGGAPWRAGHTLPTRCGGAKWAQSARQMEGFRESQRFSRDVRGHCGRGLRRGAGVAGCRLGAAACIANRWPTGLHGTSATAGCRCQRPGGGLQPAEPAGFARHRICSVCGRSLFHGRARHGRWAHWPRDLGNPACRCALRGAGIRRLRGRTGRAPRTFAALRSAADRRASPAARGTGAGTGPCRERTAR
jgi:hypothetical protein